MENTNTTTSSGVQQEQYLAPCPDCGQPTEQFPALHIRLRCDTCAAREEAEATQSTRSADDARRAAHWRSICPAEYRDTDPKDPRLDPTCLAAARAWCHSITNQNSPADAKSVGGLGLVGATRLGKTRCLYLALQARHRAGQRVMAVRAKVHARAATTAAGGNHADSRTRDTAHQLLRRCITADVLLLDDLGKGTPTPRAIEAMEDLVEERTSRRRPILWSANAGSEWLAHHFGEDSGPAIIARLAEFSHIPDLPR